MLVNKSPHTIIPDGVGNERIPFEKDFSAFINHINYIFNTNYLYAYGNNERMIAPFISTIFHASG